VVNIAKIFLSSLFYHHANCSYCSSYTVWCVQDPQKILGMLGPRPFRWERDYFSQTRLSHHPTCVSMWNLVTVVVVKPYCERSGPPLTLPTLQLRSLGGNRMGMMGFDGNVQCTRPNCPRPIPRPRPSTPRPRLRSSSIRPYGSSLQQSSINFTSRN